MNAAELLLNGQPDAVAPIEGKRQVTYRKLRLAVRQAAAAWRTRAMAAGDVGIVAMLVSVDIVAALSGLMWINAIPSPISPLVRDNAPTLFFSVPTLYQRLLEKPAGGKQ